MEYQFPKVPPRTFAKEAAIALLLNAQMVAKKGIRDEYPSSEELKKAFQKIASFPEKELRRVENDILPEKFLVDCLELIIEAAKIDKSIVTNEQFFEKTKEKIQKGQLYEVSDKLMDLVDAFQSAGIIQT